MTSAPVGSPRRGPGYDPVTGEVVFRIDATWDWTPVRVWYHLRMSDPHPEFAREGDFWVARMPRPPVDRLEYLVVLRHPDGGESWVPDPTNPQRVPGVFGDKSVLEFPGYRPAWWVAVADAADAQARRDARVRSAGPVRRPALAGRAAHTAGSSLVPVGAARSDEAEPGPRPPTPGEGIGSIAHQATTDDLDDRRTRLPGGDGRPAGTLVAGDAPDLVVEGDAAVEVHGQLHVPADSSPAEPLPLLVVHDGPEYDRYCDLLRYVAMLARIDPALRCRALLLQPVDRDRSYSASPAYARALVLGLLPRLRTKVAVRGPLVGVGSSLGGLALMHAAVSQPGTFGGILSQSGSFFRPRSDGMERGYRWFSRITRFVDVVDAEPERLAGLRVAMTCGTGEENLANNQSMARRLTKVGVPTTLVQNPDGHNHVGWRDCLDPSLRDLLAAVWVPPGS